MNDDQFKSDHTLHSGVQMTEFQIGYLVVYVLSVFFFLGFGPCLSAMGVTDDVSYSMTIAIALAVSTLSAAWGVLSALPVLVRLPIAAVGLAASCGSVFAAFSAQSGGSHEAVMFTFTPAIAFVLALFPLLFLRYMYGWKISFNEPLTSGDDKQVQFTIRHLFIATTVFAAILGVARLIAIPLQNLFLDDEITIFIGLLAISATFIGVVTICATLASNNVVVGIAGAAVLIAVMTGVELFLLKTTTGMPTKFFLIVSAMNVMTSVMIGVAMVVLRPIGLRLWTVASSF